MKIKNILLLSALSVALIGCGGSKKSGVIGGASGSVSLHPEMIAELNDMASNPPVVTQYDLQTSPFEAEFIVSANTCKNILFEFNNITKPESATLQTQEKTVCSSGLGTFEFKLINNNFQPGLFAMTIYEIKDADKKALYQIKQGILDYKATLLLTQESIGAIESQPAPQQINQADLQHQTFNFSMRYATDESVQRVASLEFIHVDANIDNVIDDDEIFVSNPAIVNVNDGGAASVEFTIPTQDGVLKSGNYILTVIDETNAPIDVYRTDAGYVNIV